MKFGIRKPSLKKSFSARTKGQLTRSIKRALIPGYGKRGMGWLHPKRALYNRVYHRTTVGVGDIARLAAGAAAAKQQRPARTAARTAAPAAVHRPTRAERVQRLRLRLNVLSAAEQQEVDTYITPKLPSKRTAYLLWFFTGLLGGHRFYLKSYISGALMAIFLIALTPLTVLWWIIDLFRLSGMLDDRKLELGEEAVTNIEQRHLEEQKLHPAPIVETMDPKPAATEVPENVPADVPVEAWYPADTEKFQRNEAETEFLRQLYVLLKDKGLSPNPMEVHRLSDGTLKFTYGGQELGRVRLQKRKHTVTVWQNGQETELEGELPDFLPKLESWLERVRKE
nr:TM2 domain-containing protein [Acidaminococcus timonensis]